MSDFTPTFILDEPVTNIAGVNAVQTITVKAKKGTFKVIVEGDETAAIAFNAEAATVLAALNKLGAVDPGDVVVTGGPGDELGTKPYVLAWAGHYAGANAPTVTTDAASLEEGAHTAAVATTTVGTAANAAAVQRGTGYADRTADVAQLTGESPAENRAENAEDYGD